MKRLVLIWGLITSIWVLGCDDDPVDTGSVPTFDETVGVYVLDQWGDRPMPATHERTTISEGAIHLEADSTFVSWLHSSSIFPGPPYLTQSYDTVRGRWSLDSDEVVFSESPISTFGGGSTRGLLNGESLQLCTTTACNPPSNLDYVKQ